MQPNKPSSKAFDDALTEISPSFVDIYHQAEAAEAYTLTQICGMGYRKALEFLIKDYAIHTNPNDEKKIISAALSSCIQSYINHSKIQATATAAAWLGNDEAHYIRKWENKDITDLKRFIDSCIYWILSECIANEAAEMISQ